ncbi:TetR/AcrR family transcriptional regulator [Streptomyces chartreusis]|uniref:TetR/AcrR family transcriptional regulator n=1 Tax=Streptomyces chartreusis TaxID=1969 RepID=UPI0036256349
MTEPTPPRPRRGRGARERILKAATELFMAQGITATGTDQLARAAGVSKRTLYVYFSSKDELVQAYLTSLEHDRLPASASPSRTPSDARELLLAVFDPKPPRAAGPYRGCPFLNAGVEVPDPEHPAHRLAAAHKREFAHRLTELARQAGAAAPQTLGEQLALLYDGAAARGVALDSGQTSACARSIAEVLIDAALTGSGPDTAAAGADTPQAAA